MSLDPLISLEKSTVEPSKESSDEIALKAKNYLKLYSQTGQDRYILSCERVLEGLNEYSTDICLIRAKLAYEVHHYQDAQVWLNSVIAKDPVNINALGLMVFVCLAMGRYKDAESLCQNIILHGNHLIATSCVSAISLYTGKAISAKSLLTRVLQQDSNLDVSQSDLTLYSVMTAANLFWSIGENRSAELYFLKSLDIETPYQRSLIQYMDFLIEQGRSDEVVEHLRNVTLSNPLQLRFAQALKDLDDPSWLDHTETLKSVYSIPSSDSLKDNGSSDFERMPLKISRECIRYAFLNKDSSDTKTFELAKWNWRHQKTLEDARLFLRAAYKPGFWQFAKPVIEWARKNRIEDYQVIRLIREGNARI